MRRVLGIGLLLGLAIVVRMVGLAWPNQVVFDEVHFGKFVNAYCCTGERIFDIHPPHAKLLIAGAVSLTDYNGGFLFKNIGQEYVDVPIVAFRIVPVIVGITLPLVIFWLLRLLKVSLLGSFFGGLVIVFENALIVQSRVVSLDGVLLLGTFLSLAMALQMRKSNGWHSFGWAILSGTVAGLAVGAKFTGLVGLGLVGLIIFVDFFKSLGRKFIVRQFLVGAVMLVSFLIVYLSGWWIHFELLTNLGPGDAWRVPSEGFLVEVYEWHKIMLGANYGLEAKHPDASPWWSWPVMARPVFYWQASPMLGGTSRSAIYFWGNPVVWIGSTVILLTTFFVWWRRLKVSQAWIMVVGFLMSLIPLMQVPRALFLYHYLTPLIFAVILSMWWIDGALKNKFWFMLALVSLVGGWLLVSPVTYGWPVPGFLVDIIARLPRF